MKVSKLRLVTNDLECVVSYLDDFMPFNCRHLDDETVVLTKKSSPVVLSHSAQNVVILKKDLNYIDIDIIEGERTAAPIFNLIRKPQNHFIGKIETIFDRFCEEFIVGQKVGMPAYSMIGVQQSVGN